MNTTVSYSKYMLIGTLMLMLCIILMVIFTNYFKNVDLYIKDYQKSTCVITSLNFDFVPYTCFSYDGIATIVSDMPCIDIHVSTDKHTNVKFYRNYQEKSSLALINLSSHVSNLKFFAPLLR